MPSLTIPFPSVSRDTRPSLAAPIDRAVNDCSSVANTTPRDASRGSNVSGKMTNAPAPQKTVVFYLQPEFTMLAFCAAIEPLRGANRVLGYDAYKWRLVSKTGEPVTASNGVEVGSTPRSRKSAS
jgi:hypothetical protein